MDWTQVLTIVASNIGLILWARTESRSDIRHLEQKSMEMIQCIKDDIKAIHLEIKDFHGRLCAIEERNKEKK